MFVFYILLTADRVALPEPPAPAFLVGAGARILKVEAAAAWASPNTHRLRNMYIYINEIPLKTKKLLWSSLNKNGYGLRQSKKVKDPRFEGFWIEANIKKW